MSIDNTDLTFWITETEKTVVYHLGDIDQVAVKGDHQLLEHIPYNPLVLGNNRLLYSETGLNLLQGEMEYRTVWGIIHTLDYGVTDGVTVGAGIVYPGYVILHSKLNLIHGRRQRAFRLGMDFKTALRGIRVMDDFLNREVTRFRGFFQFSIFSSVGTEDRTAHFAINITPLIEPQNFGGSVFSFTFGGTIRVAPHWKIVYENSFGVFFGGFGGFAGDVGMFSGIGATYFRGQHAITVAIKPSANFGFVNFPLSDTNNMHRLPFFSYAYYF